MEPNFDDLESSFSVEDSLLDSGNIDHLYRTYLGSMDSFDASYGASEHYSARFESQRGHERSARQRGAAAAAFEAVQNVNIGQWRGEECVEWAANVCRRRGLDQSTVDFCAFRNTTGSLLQQFSLQDFCTLVGDNIGRLFYQDFRSLLKRQGAGAALEDSPDGNSSIFNLGSRTASEGDSWAYTKDDLQALDKYILEDSWDPQQDDLQDLELQEQFMPIRCDDFELQHPAGQSFAQGLHGTQYSLTHSSSASSTNSDSDVFKKIPTHTRRRERGPKCWEFLVRLLADPRTNPSVIRWEDDTDANFRLIQPDFIARMWGARSGKPNLSYVNFARGLRYHYNTGALEAVSERQLVYKCGPKALKYLKQLQQEGL